MEYLGIDLGTTNSLCCVWQDGRSVLIPNVLGEYLTPSAVGIDENGSVLVGALARERLVTHPETTTHNFKRLMGTGVLTNLGSRDFLPEELSAFVLRRLREDAERYLGRTIDEAVISVPAYFNDDQRYATKAAAQLAGLHVQRLVNEPSAAALAYRQDMDEEDSRFLVFDFGGGTLDVSLVDCFDNVVEIVAVAGDNQLGGIDLDLLLAEHFCRETGLDLAALPSAAKAALIRTAESCKQALSRQEHTVMSLQFGQQCYTLPLDQQMLAKVSIPWLERCVAPVERVLRDADETLDSMDAILLVGGSCNMPLVQRYLRYRFAKPVHVSRHPDTLVAHGTGVFAGIKGRKQDLREVMLTDVCPFTLGVDVLSGEETVMFPMIERNSVLPSSIQHRFATAHSFQTQLDVSVYQGEDRYPHNNLYLGKVVVHVPPAPIGEQSVLVRFTYDINGILMVDVTHEESGKTQSLTLLGKRVQFTEEEWAAKCRELEALKLHPLEQEENRHLLAWGERLYQETVGALRANLGQMLEWLNQEFHSQDQHRIGRAKRSARKLFQSVEEQQFTFGEIDFEQLFYGEGE